MVHSIETDCPAHTRTLPDLFLTHPGYISGNPAKRTPGAIPSALANYTLIITGAVAAFQFLQESDFQL